MNYKVVQIGKKRFALPFLDLIPIAADDKADLTASVKANGILEPVVAWKEKSTGGIVYIIDGANRLLIAERLKLRKVPLRWISATDEQEAKLKCRILNLHRRHLTRDEKRHYVQRCTRTKRSLNCR